MNNPRNTTFKEVFPRNYRGKSNMSFYIKLLIIIGLFRYLINVPFAAGATLSSADLEARFADERETSGEILLHLNFCLRVKPSHSNANGF